MFNEAGDTVMIVAVSGWRLNKHTVSIWSTLIMRVARAFEVDHLYLRGGDCPTGTDEHLRQYLYQQQVGYSRYHARWDQRGPAAGPIRNGKMLRGESRFDSYAGQQAHLLLAFPEPGPRKPGSGTWNCADQARDLGIEVWFPKER